MKNEKVVVHLEEIKTLDDAVEFLYLWFEGMDFNMDEDAFAALCHSQLSGGIGMQIRNMFGFWQKESDLKTYLEKEHKCGHPDEMSDLIIRHVYRKKMREIVDED